MKTRAFSQIDVFANGPWSGNPLAVVHDGSGLSTEQMHAFANWTNLSETTFVLPPTRPEADYAVRIFTATVELPFAGHPTLGTCHALLQAGVQPKKAGMMVQECAAGLIPIRVSDQTLAFAAPPLKRADPLSREEIHGLALGVGLTDDDVVAGQWCDNGPGWRALLLNSHSALMRAKPDVSKLQAAVANEVSAKHTALSLPKLGLVHAFAPDVGLIAKADQGASVDFEVRAFFPANGVYFEDPVTGSLNAAAAQWLIGSGVAPPRYVAAQGTALGRNGRIYVNQDEDGIWIGGQSTTCITGTVRL